MNTLHATEEDARFVMRLTGQRVLHRQPVQQLWSGYGEIIRVTLSLNSESSDSDLRTLILKTVHPPRSGKHPYGWSSDAGHTRKIRSYEIEQAFYETYARECSKRCRVASCYGSEAQQGRYRLLLEDLDASGFAERRATLRVEELDRCLRWLAAFHATFMARDPDRLWRTGTYWHLATRGEELAALNDSELRDAASDLDHALNSCRYQTLVHGDAKVANFCFAPDAVAAVDFQYVGGGCGMKDVAYFLSSCLDDAQCQAQASGHLDTYFRMLRDELAPQHDADAIEREWRSLYPAAWADFHRFLAGWAPGHWKIHDYTREMTRAALTSLRGGGKHDR